MSPRNDAFGASARHVLAINVGSSSLRYDLVLVVDGVVRARHLSGMVSQFGRRAEVTETIGALSSRTARSAIESIEEAALLACVRAATIAGELELPIAGVAHRIVHGGVRFTRPTRLRARELAELAKLSALAPLHQPPALRALAICTTEFGTKVPQIGVFDTAFHATLPEAAWRLPIPGALADRHGLRRFGFHGVAFESVLRQLAKKLERPPQQLNAILFHLGSGCSVAAIRKGRCVDTTMGLSPLEGVMMRTRSGSLDPMLAPTLARLGKTRLDSVVEMLWTQSGLAGVSSSDGDIRTLLGREKRDARARIALEMFVLSLRKQLGAYFALLGDVDAIAFSGGVGENSPVIRARILAGLEALGIRLDASRNRAPRRAGGLLTTPRSVRVFAIHADEAQVLAERGAEVLDRASGRA